MATHRQHGDDSEERASALLDKKTCQGDAYAMPGEVVVVEDAAVAATALDPLRASLLDHLAREPSSAAGLAARVGVGRQKVNYHLHILETAGLVSEVGHRRHGGLTERMFSPAAAGFVVSPAAFGRAGAHPARVGDRLSASYAIAVAARVIREVGRMLGDAERAAKRLPTLTIDVDIRFRSAADRSAFAAEAGAAVRALAAKYHDEASRGGRWYRVAMLSHPKPEESND